MLLFFPVFLCFRFGCGSCKQSLAVLGCEDILLIAEVTADLHLSLLGEDIVDLITADRYECASGAFAAAVTDIIDLDLVKQVKGNVLERRCEDLLIALSGCKQIGHRRQELRVSLVSGASLGTGVSLVVGASLTGVEGIWIKSVFVGLLISIRSISPEAVIIIVFSIFSIIIPFL